MLTVAESFAKCRQVTLEDGTVAGADSAAAGGRADARLIRAHGALMYAAFGVLLPVVENVLRTL